MSQEKRGKGGGPVCLVCLAKKRVLLFRKKERLRGQGNSERGGEEKSLCRGIDREIRRDS